MVKDRSVNAQELEKGLKRDARTATKKSAIHKRLSGNSKQKAGTLTQQVQYLRDELEITQDKAKDEVYNLKSLLNVDAVKKETLDNIV